MSSQKKNITSSKLHSSDEKSISSSSTLEIDIDRKETILCNEPLCPSPQIDIDRKDLMSDEDIGRSANTTIINKTVKGLCCSDEQPCCSSSVKNTSGKSDACAETQPEEPPVWLCDIKNVRCAFCRNQLTKKCIQCQILKKKEKCKVAWGKCSHAFHYHCVSRFLKERSVCPLDDTVWEYEKIGNSKVKRK
ncbi:RING-box protein 1b-like [Teleopsis dalmanni]|uniref:RING-box protein 1b-like n=1 Tax=Teleopsis dalmanni TaxID=139649 RepID=UPI0018CF36BF|nr:RING-box protein 1b-like [Teleopsis dalmanni]